MQFGINHGDMKRGIGSVFSQGSSLPIVHVVALTPNVGEGIEGEFEGLFEDSCEMAMLEAACGSICR